MLLTSTFSAQTGTAFAAASGCGGRCRGDASLTRPGPADGPSSKPNPGHGGHSRDQRIDQKQPQKEATRT
jgi:hypothetical protein